MGTLKGRLGSETKPKAAMPKVETKEAKFFARAKQVAPRLGLMEGADAEQRKDINELIDDHLAEMAATDPNKPKRGRKGETAADYIARSQKKIDGLKAKVIAEGANLTKEQK